MVTGSKGMLGQAIMTELEADYRLQVVGISRETCDLRNKSDFADVMRREKPDLIIHCAAVVGGIQANISNPFEFLSANVEIDSNVINGALDLGTKRLIYVGSSCMYPKNSQLLLVEDHLLTGQFEPTNENYALAKVLGWKLCEAATNSFGVAYKTIIPSNLYGPGDNFDPKRSHLVASAIHKVHSAKIRGDESIVVWGSGLARREFTYVFDLSRWIYENILSVENLPPVLNLGYGEDFSVDEFFNFAMKAVDYSVELEHDDSGPEGMVNKLMDSSLAREKYAWNPMTSVEKGIEETYEWYLRRGVTFG